MSVSGEEEQPPELRQWIGEGGERASSEQPAAASEGAVRRQWSEDEWRAWNQWWDWRSYGPSYWSWSSPERVQGREASEAAVASDAAAAAATPPGDSRARDPFLDSDPWGRNRASSTWQDSKNNESKWWGASSKGDYADPPAWAGWGHYKLWRRSLLRWDSNTDVALYRRSEKILKGLDWELQAKLDHLTEETLSTAGYLQAIFGVLDVLAGEKDDSEKRRAIRAALYEGHRKSDESLAQYALRRESQFSSASRFIDIPNELKAFMLEEQSGLTRQGSQNLRVLTEGKHEYERVRKALQVLDTEDEPIFKSGKNNYLAAEVEEPSEPDEESDEDMIDEEVFLAIAEKDLDEDEVAVFLAQMPKRRTWSENKQLKAARKKDRRHFDDKTSRPEKVGGHRRLPKSSWRRSLVVGTVVRRAIGERTVIGRIAPRLPERRERGPQEMPLSFWAQALRRTSRAPFSPSPAWPKMPTWTFSRCLVVMRLLIQVLHRTSSARRAMILWSKPWPNTDCSLWNWMRFPLQPVEWVEALSHCFAP